MDLQISTNAIVLTDNHTVYKYDTMKNEFDVTRSGNIIMTLAKEYILSMSNLNEDSTTESILLCAMAYYHSIYGCKCDI